MNMLINTYLESILLKIFVLILVKFSFFNILKESCLIKEKSN